MDDFAMSSAEQREMHNGIKGRQCHHPAWRGVLVREASFFSGQVRLLDRGIL
jgi:hypothetical protein